jgi:hypothetical protein
MATRSIPTTVEAIELAVANLKEQIETEDAGKIKGGIQNVTEASMRLGEAIYKAQQEDAEGEAERRMTTMRRGRRRRHRRRRFRGPR